MSEAEPTRTTPTPENPAPAADTPDAPVPAAVAPTEAATELRRWLGALGLATVAPGADVAAVTGRVVTGWQASGLFLDGARAEEIASLLARSTDG